MASKIRTPAQTPEARAPRPTAPAAPKRAPRSATGKATAPAPVPAAVKTDKAVKARPRLVRDSFTMPETDFALIAALKTRALVARRAAKKSELLRAGLHALAALDAKTLVVALDQLEPVKTGRPRTGR
jgi:hypothetical protein